MARRTVRWHTLIVLIGGCVLLAQPAWAQDPVHKLGRGLVNVLTGWIELPKQIHHGKQEDNPVTGIVAGTGKGIASALLRTGVGVFEVVTFPFPYPSRYASPFESMALPDYAWE